MTAWPELTIAGLGPAGLDLTPPEVVRLAKETPSVVVRTARHPAVDELRELIPHLRSLDHLYDAANDFSLLYPALAAEVWSSSLDGPLLYLTPGHPVMGEESVRILLRRAREESRPVEIIAAPSFVDLALTALAGAGVDADWSGWSVVDGWTLSRVDWSTERPALIFQVDHSAALSRAKLALLEEYPGETEVAVIRRAGLPDQSVTWRRLHRIDWEGEAILDHLTSLYIPPLPAEERRADFRDYVELVAMLRSPEGCPWDRAQTPESLKRYVLEEAYEVLEAIDSQDAERLQDELGDLLLQVLLQSQIATESDSFTIRDVIAGAVEKLTRRHPHVFSDASAENPEEVVRHWEAVKQQEKPERTSAMDGVPRELPALMKALKVSKKAVRVGFEWPTLEAVIEKLHEEIEELQQEIPGADPARLEEEIGDLLFTVVNLARWLQVDPEEALRRMVDRFDSRFREMEHLARQAGSASLSGLSIEELDSLWTEAKRRAETPVRRRASE